MTRTRTRNRVHRVVNAPIMASPYQSCFKVGPTRWSASSVLKPAGRVAQVRGEPMPFANQPVQGDLLRHSVVRFLPSCEQEASRALSRSPELPLEHSRRDGFRPDRGSPSGRGREALGLQGVASLTAHACPGGQATNTFAGESSHSPRWTGMELYSEQDAETKVIVPTLHDLGYIEDHPQRDVVLKYRHPIDA